MAIIFGLFSVFVFLGEITLCFGFDFAVFGYSCSSFLITQVFIFAKAIIIMAIIMVIMAIIIIMVIIAIMAILFATVIMVMLFIIASLVA